MTLLWSTSHHVGLVGGRRTEREGYWGHWRAGKLRQRTPDNIAAEDEEYGKDITRVLPLVGKLARRDAGVELAAEQLKDERRHGREGPKTRAVEDRWRAVEYLRPYCDIRNLATYKRSGDDGGSTELVWFLRHSGAL